MLKHLHFISGVLLLLLFVGDTRILVVVITGIRLAVVVELIIEVVEEVPVEVKYILLIYMYILVQYLYVNACTMQCSHIL